MPRVDTRLPAPSQVTTRTRIGVTPESSDFTGCQVRVCFTACQVGTRRTPERPFSMRRGPCSRRTATSASASKRSPARPGSRARRSTCTSRRRPSCSGRSTNASNAQDVAPAFEKVWAADTAAAALDAWVDAVAEAVPKFIGIATTRSIAARRSDPDVQATWDAPAESQYANCVRLAQRLKRDKQLIPRMSAADAADILWCQTSIGAYESLVVDRGVAPRTLGRVAEAVAPHVALRRHAS